MHKYKYDTWYCVIRPDNLFIGVKVNSKTNAVEVVNKNLANDPERVKRIKSGETSKHCNSFVDRRDLNMLRYEDIFKRAIIGVADKRQRDSADNDPNSRETKRIKNESTTGPVLSQGTIVNTIVGLVKDEQTSSNRNNNNDGNDVIMIDDDDDDLQEIQTQTQLQKQQAQIRESGATSSTSTSTSAPQMQNERFSVQGLLSYYLLMIEKYDINKYGVGDSSKKLAELIFKNLAYPSEEGVKEIVSRMSEITGEIPKKFIFSIMDDISPVRVLFQTSQPTFLTREYKVKYVKVANAVIKSLFQKARYDVDIVIESVRHGFDSLLVYCKENNIRLDLDSIHRIRQAFPKEYMAGEVLGTRIDELTKYFLDGLTGNTNSNTRATNSNRNGSNNNNLVAIEDNNSTEVNLDPDDYQEEDQTSSDNEVDRVIEIINKNDISYLENIDDKYKNNTRVLSEITRLFLNNNPSNFFRLPTKFQVPRLAVNSINRDPNIFMKLDVRLRGLKSVSLSAVRKNPQMIQYVPPKIRGDNDIIRLVQRSVKDNPNLSKYIPNTQEAKPSATTSNNNNNSSSTRSNSGATASASASAPFIFINPGYKGKEKADDNLKNESKYKPTTTTTTNASASNVSTNYTGPFTFGNIVRQPSSSSQQQQYPNIQRNTESNARATTTTNNNNNNNNTDLDNKKQLKTIRTSTYDLSGLPEDQKDTVLSVFGELDKYIKEKEIILTYLGINDDIIKLIVDYIVDKAKQDNIRKINIVDLSFNYIGDIGYKYIINRLQGLVNVLNINQNEKITDDCIAENIVKSGFVAINVYRRGTKPEPRKALYAKIEQAGSKVQYTV